MERRMLLSLVAAGLITPMSAVLAGGDGFVPYSRSAYDQAIASGKPLLLDFSSKS